MSNIDVQTHYIGGDSDFDIDMSLYENIVNFHTRRDQLDIDTLYYYYLGALLSYWNKIRDLYSFNTLEEAKEHFKIPEETIGYGNDFDTIKQTFSIYEKEFNLKITKIKGIYAKNKVDIYEIIEIFNYMVTIACFKKSSRTFLETSYKIKNLIGIIYPLTNDSGVFSLNGYMYCYINNILLVGFPSSFSSYDKNLGCPEAFLDHDLDHIKTQKYPETFNSRGPDLTDQRVKENYIRPLYFSILNSKLDRDHKEYLIFALWAVIHEIIDLNPLRKRNFTREVVTELDFFELKEKDFEEMNNYVSEKMDMSDPVEGRVAIMYYYYVYVMQFFPNMFKELNIESYYARRGKHFNTDTLVPENIPKILA